MAGSLKSSATPLVALIGRPNVGKSSLFNRLVGGRQAITHETAGTTRDANYGSVEWRGKRLLLVDTAGLIGGGAAHRPQRKATASDGDGLEAAVQEQVEAVAGLANVLVLVVDAGTMLTTEDELAAELARKSGKPLVLAINKADTADGRPEEVGESLGITPAVVTSAIHGRGSGDLLDAIVAQTPDAPAADRTETDEPVVPMALVGRPNVGKSSLLNALAGKQQAIVSERAGTTRDVGSVELRYHSQTIRLLDTAGLRRHGRIEPGIERYSSLRTLAAIARADVCAVVMDSSEPSVAGDQHIAGEVIEAGKGLILVMNKWDVVDKETGTQERFTRQLVGDFAFAPWAPLVYTSATQGLNVTRLFALATQIAATRTQQLSTGELNRIISELVAKHPPAGRKNRQPKIKYVTQTGINPPTFTFFCSYPDLIHFSYVRYLENGLRERYAFEGTPIKLEFRSKRS